jgi:hypothetical protein
VPCLMASRVNGSSAGFVAELDIFPQPFGVPSAAAMCAALIRSPDRAARNRGYAQEKSPAEGPPGIAEFIP